jgi:hypothetical protein
LQKFFGKFSLPIAKSEEMVYNGAMGKQYAFSRYFSENITTERIKRLWKKR